MGSVGGPGKALTSITTTFDKTLTTLLYTHTKFIDWLIDWKWKTAMYKFKIML